MLKASPGPSSKASKIVSLVVFSVGGYRLAVKAGDVGGVWPWTAPSSIPSGTPFIAALMRRGQDVLPVYDLASRLGVRKERSDGFCLIAKHPDGPVAVCIDDEMPALHLSTPEALHPAEPGGEIEATCRVDGVEVPVYALSRLLG